MPSTSPPRSRISRAITSTSLIRGTLVSTHSSFVSRHAASNGSAAFLLPSTSTAPDNRWPPSMSSVDIRDSAGIPNPQSPIPEVHDLLTQLDAEAIAHLGAAAVDQLFDLGGGRAAVVDDEIAVRRRDACAAGDGALETGAIHERAGGPRHAVRHGVA